MVVNNILPRTIALYLGQGQVQACSRNTYAVYHSVFLFLQVAVLCQFLEPLDYTLAFNALKQTTRSVLAPYKKRRLCYNILMELFPTLLGCFNLLESTSHETWNEQLKQPLRLFVTDNEESFMFSCSNSNFLSFLPLCVAL